MQTIVINNVPADRLDHYKKWAEALGGQVTSIAQEPDKEFTVVIIVPAAASGQAFG